MTLLEPLCSCRSQHEAEEVYRVDVVAIGAAQAVNA
jgi:hypothetical protein